MKTLKYGNKLIIMDGKDPLRYVDLSTKRFYAFPVYSEEAEWPIYRWWRNPIKWYRWRKLLKISGRNTKIVLQTTPEGPNPFWKKSDLE